MTLEIGNPHGKISSVACLYRVRDQAEFQRLEMTTKRGSHGAVIAECWIPSLESDVGNTLEYYFVFMDGRDERTIATASLPFYTTIK